MKKIGIDIRLTNNQRGIASYITNLLINYQGLISDSNIEVYLMSDRTPTNEIKKLNFKTIILPIKIYPLWDFIIPFILFFSITQNLVAIYIKKLVELISSLMFGLTFQE